MHVLPLAAAHRAAGAAFVEDMGWELVAHHGDAEGEERLVPAAAAVFDQSYRGILDLGSKDAAAVLDGVFSSDVKSLATGAGQPSCLLNARGRLVGAFHLFSLAGGGLRLVLGEPLRDPFVKAVARYCVLSDIAVEERNGALAILSLQGPRAAEALAGLDPGASLPEMPLGTGTVRLAGAEVIAVRGGETPEGGFDLWVPRAALGEVWRELVRGARAVGGGPAGQRALEVLRIEAGVPRHGKEYSEESFPNEVGWEGALRYNKCYVGQEIVARMRTYGQVHRRLRGLRWPGGELPAPGAVVWAESEEAGTITSAAASRRLGSSIGLALIKRRFWDAGRLRIDAAPGSITAEALELPFVRAPSRQ